MIRAELTIPEGVTQFHAVWEYNNQVWGRTFKFFVDGDQSYWAYYDSEEDMWIKVSGIQTAIPCPDTAMYLFCVA